MYEEIPKNKIEKAHIGTVLIVDDDDNWCFISRKLLTKAGIGDKIITAYNGMEAIKKLTAFAADGVNQPDLIFLDIKMPVMDGFEFLDEVVNSDFLDLNKTRIFICSSSLHPKDRIRANQYPIAGFITKPLTREILREIIG